MRESAHTTSSSNPSVIPVYPSVWVQVDDQIGTQTKSARMGNWLDVHPAGVYDGWAGDTDNPVTIVLKHTGDHKIRVQPRQTPHRIDQIWLRLRISRIGQSKIAAKFFQTNTAEI